MSDHYSRLSPQPILVIENWHLDFHLGNAVKYIARAAYKGDEVRDLAKASWYIRRRIQLLTMVPPPPPEEQA